MVNILNAAPGQECTIVLETFDGYERADGYALPEITRIIFPDLTESDGYPQDMTQIDTGLYMFTFTLPTGAAAVGSYLVDVDYYQPGTMNVTKVIYQVIVSAPFGRYFSTSS